MDTAQWPEGIGIVGKPPLQVVGNSSGQVPNSNVNNKATTNGGGGGGGGVSGSRPQIKAQASNCPRCNSSHTKFCYYNNYSLSQPRFFCKTCRRYWTEGGSLRNVPVGGGSRKNKRSHSSSSSSSAASSSVLSKIRTANDSQNPNSKIIFREGQDLNLAYPPPISMPKFAEFPSSTTSTSTSYLQDQLMNVGNGIRGFSSFMSMFNPLTSSDAMNILPEVYSSSTSSASTIATSAQLPSFQELFSKTTSGSLDFSRALIGNTNSDHQQHQELMLSSAGTNNNEKLFFPFENLKHEQPGILHDSSSTTPQELMEQQMSIRATESSPPHQLTTTGSYTWNNINGAGTASW